MCAISLMLAQPAHAVAGAAPKEPLTAAGKAQCQAQLTEFNQSAQVYNGKVDEIKALEAEFNALNAVIEKEQAVVDRRDSAAMEALNAKIDASNKLVERHEQMGRSIEAMASESKLRAAQFREQCENRPVAPLSPPRSQPKDPVCGSTDGAKGVERQIEAALVEMRGDEKRHQAEVDRVYEARAKAQSWGDEKRGKIWLQVLGSPRFMAFEREKRPLVQELMRVLGSKPRNGQEECRLIQRIAATLPAIKAINARQYAFMADEIRVAK
ncbi:hypothetical protein [Pseudoduganella chitinolytica]|uniref:Uncharacterized protein n=1 Tax=Pseudoduganella chitinolytica TaxID=34070 RepID=A0ABY8BEX6_9BURK|nr:hypothetical protein [Pseudoduganella chitinolytica]WEF32899.1 hypothetical protein PX653_26480 [Pseudoduganella chitinolytica]